MKAAKHRIESLMTPLFRFSLHTEAFLQFAQKLAVLKGKDNAGKVAQLFLDTITEEMLLQAAMLADAGFEA